MARYYMRIASHYSGLFCGQFPDVPGVVVLGNDHHEVEDLALLALEEELERRLNETGKIPVPRYRGRISVVTTRF